MLVKHLYSGTVSHILKYSFCLEICLIQERRKERGAVWSLIVLSSEDMKTRLEITIVMVVSTLNVRSHKNTEA